jgi:hypothetical protein
MAEKLGDESLRLVDQRHEQMLAVNLGVAKTDRQALGVVQRFL